MSEPVVLPLAGMPGPEPDDLSRPFWQGLEAGEILAPRCLGCRRLHFPVLPSCPHCGAGELEWEGVGDEARVFSWIVVRRGVVPTVPVPYTVVLGEFPGGVKIPGNLLAVAELRVEGPLRARIVAGNGIDVVAYEATVADG
jgi:uncharacterized OB-fold protein